MSENPTANEAKINVANQEEQPINIQALSHPPQSLHFNPR